MVRQFKYLETFESKDLRSLKKKRWPREKLMVLFAMNSVYQVVLGPQEAACQRQTAGLGNLIPVVHGTFAVDMAFTTKTRVAVSEFFEMARRFGFHEYWMTLNTCGDVVYWVAKYENDDEGRDPKGGVTRKS